MGRTNYLWATRWMWTWARRGRTGTRRQGPYRRWSNITARPLDTQRDLSGGLKLLKTTKQQNEYIHEHQKNDIPTLCHYDGGTAEQLLRRQTDTLRSGWRSDRIWRR